MATPRRHLAARFDREPYISAIYPTFAIVCWAEPTVAFAPAGKPEDHGVASLVEAPVASPPNRSDVVSAALPSCDWQFTVEWVGSHGGSQEARSVTQTLLHIVIPIDFPNETYFIRVVARSLLPQSALLGMAHPNRGSGGLAASGSTGGEQYLVAASKLSFQVFPRTPLPWAMPHAVYSRLLIDSLALCSSNLGWREAISPLWTPDEVESSELIATRMLGPNFASHVIRATYRIPPAPASTRIVFFLVACTRAAVREREQLTQEELMAWMSADSGEASAVFCGIGDLGTSACCGAHLFIQQAIDQNAALAHRTWCITFGTPRRAFFENSLVLEGTARFTGSFLHYTGAIDMAEASNGYPLASSSLHGGADGSVSAPFITSASSSGSLQAARKNGGAVATGGSQSRAGHPVTPPAGFAGTATATSARGARTPLLTDTVPLGVRCGPVLDPIWGRTSMKTEVSALECVSAVERHERFDAALHLGILGRLLYGDLKGSTLFSPALDVVSWNIVDGVMIELSITGRNLQHSPLLTIVGAGSDLRIPASCNGVTPTCITTLFSLIELTFWTAQASAVDGQPGDDSSAAFTRFVDIDITVTTDLGVASLRGVRIDVPADLAELVHHVAWPQPALSWVVSHPTHFLGGAIVLEPLLSIVNRGLASPHTGFAGAASGAVRGGAESYAGDASGGSQIFSAYLTTHLLMALSTAREIISWYAAKKQSTSLLSFVTTVASRVSGAGPPSQALTPMKLIQPPTRDAMELSRILSDYARAKKRSVSSLIASLEPWKQRILQTFSWGSEARYKDMLRSYIVAVARKDVVVDAPIPLMEWTLWTSVVRYLRDICGLNVVSHESLHKTLTFESFYHHMHPLFLALVPIREHMATDIVLEAASLWAVCLVYHLRMTIIFSQFIAVTGCAGSGCSTIANVTNHLVSEMTLTYPHSHRRKNVIVRCVHETELDCIKEVLHLGISALVVLVGEKSDFHGKGYRAIHESIARSMGAEWRQRIFYVVSKIDEHMGGYEPCGNDWASPTTLARHIQEFVTHLTSSVYALALVEEHEVVGKSTDDSREPMALRGVAFAPAVHCVRVWMEEAVSHSAAGGGEGAHGFGFEPEVLMKELMRISAEEARVVVRHVIPGYGAASE